MYDFSGGIWADELLQCGYELNNFLQQSLFIAGLFTNLRHSQVYM
jgi:hypothetical protein